MSSQLQMSCSTCETSAGTGVEALTSEGDVGDAGDAGSVPSLVGGFVFASGMCTIVPSGICDLRMADLVASFAARSCVKTSLRISGTTKTSSR